MRKPRKDYRVPPQPARLSDVVRPGDLVLNFLGPTGALAQTLDLPASMRAIPIDDPSPPPTIGLVYPHREPMTPLTAALVAEGRRIGARWMAMD